MSECNEKVTIYGLGTSSSEPFTKQNNVISK